MYEMTSSETTELRDAGYIPAWVEDLTEGMEVCYLDSLSLREVRAEGLNYPQPDFLRFATVTDLRKRTYPDSDEDGRVVGTHTIVKCFMLTEDGEFFEFTRGSGHHIWVKIPG